MKDIILEEFDSKVLPIKSGQGEAVENIYDVYRGKSGFLWLVASNIPNKADRVYCQGKKGSNGFGGAKMTFKISHGDEIVLSGAWKASASGLYEDTGVDVRNLYKGRVVVGLERVPCQPYRTIIKNVIYHEDFCLGEFTWDRAEHIAQNLANERGEEVYFYGESLGGVTKGWRKPESKNPHQLLDRGYVDE